MSIHSFFIFNRLFKDDLLTKRLIICFPQLLNEICISDEYYGQTVLHIAIAQENNQMIYFLLTNNVDVHVRSFGSFFSPADQCLNRRHDITSEFPIVPVETDYEGLTYIFIILILEIK